MAPGCHEVHGLEREATTSTTASVCRDPARVEVLVKELHGRAASGVQVDLIDAAVQQRARGTFKIDEHCERFTLLRAGGIGISFGRGDVVAVLKGSGLARRLPHLGHVAARCVAVQLPSRLSSSPLIFSFGTREAADDFHACMKVFKIMGKTGSGHREPLPEADDEDPLNRQILRDGVYSSLRTPCVETSAEPAAIRRTEP